LPTKLEAKSAAPAVPVGFATPLGPDPDLGSDTGD